MYSKQIKKGINSISITKNKLKQIFNSIIKKVIKHFIYLRIIINLFFPFSSIESEQRGINLYSSFISLKIKNTGHTLIYNPSCFQPPNKVEINGNEIPSPNYYYSINSLDYVIKLIWDDPPSTTEMLFQDLKNIAEIDLSNFDSSNIKKMSDMFKGCSCLTSVNFNNFNASKLEEMFSLFQECSSLTSIDLSGFITPKLNNFNWIFQDCYSLVFLDISNLNTSNVKYMSNIFDGCSNLTSLDLSNSDTSIVISMFKMFYGCSSLKYLNLSSFITTKVKNMEKMFYMCSSLTTLNLSSFNTTNVTSMVTMFYQCKNLKVIDISNFDISSVEEMYQMFFGCSSLISLNISHFITSKVTSMSYMFRDCSSLESLDLSNFDPSNVQSMDFMFYNCSSLNYLNLFNSKTNSLTSCVKMFEGCSSLTSLDLSYFNTSIVEEMYIIFKDCSSLVSVDVSSFDTSKISGPGMIKMFEGCSSLVFLDLSNFDISNAGNIQQMFYNCSKLKYLNFKKAQKNSNLNTYEIFKLTPSNLILCSDDENWKKVLGPNSRIIYCKDNLNNVSYYNSIDCINNITNLIIYGTDNYQICTSDFHEGYSKCYINYTICHYPVYPIKTTYVIEESTLMEKPVLSTYITESTFNILETTSLNTVKETKIEEKSTFTINTDITQNTEEYLINKSNSNYIYKETYKATSEFITTSKMIINLTDFINNEPYSSYYKDIINYTQIVKENINPIILIIESLINKPNKTDIINGKDEEIQYENILISLTTTNNQKFKENKNRTSIDLGQCENILKYNYNISISDILFIIKLDINIEGMNIPKVEYEIYYPFNDNNLTKLNLSLCKDTKIDITIPVSITDDINKYNPNSSYYNDICTSAKSDKGTDITLKDRKNEFINENMSLCEEDCEFVEYDYKKEKANCSCLTKIELPLIEDIKFNKDKLIKKFTDINYITNLQVMKCYRAVFNNNIKYNIGFFILISLVIMYLICFVIFFIYSFSFLKRDIRNITFSIKMKFKKKNITKNIRQNLLELDVIKMNQLNTIYTDHIMNISIRNSNNKTEKDKFNTMILDTSNENNNDNNNFSDDILEYKDFELNDLNYEEALKKDKRNFIQYYFALLKINHLFMFSFFPSEDYNSRIIKIFLFFFFFAVHLNINALFFNDNTMHKIYEDEGNFNFVYQLPQIIYSSLISIIINTFIKFLSLSQNKIIELKQNKVKKGLDLKAKKLISTLKIKFRIFFIVTFIILILFLYYITCFCGVYRNTQIHLINDSLISFITSLIYPFGICLLPGIFRIYALRNKKPYIYKFSKLLQLI